MIAPSTIRTDAGILRALNGEPRSGERLRAHYEIERALADRLRAAAPEQRSLLYGTVYGELFREVADHPQHRLDPAKRRCHASAQARFLRPFCNPATVFVEIGCGDAAVAMLVAGFVARSIGVDVTPALLDPAGIPANFDFRLADGISLPAADETATLVFSNQLIEHLHPDDTRAHLAEVLRILQPGGRYVCTTPNRLTGPHDISGYFGREPTGFHLVEYDHATLATLFTQCGFADVRGLVRARGRTVDLPVAPIAWLEAMVGRLPSALSRRLARAGAVRNLAGIVMAASKPLAVDRPGPIGHGVRV